MPVNPFPFRYCLHSAYRISRAVGVFALVCFTLCYSGGARAQAVEGPASAESRSSDGRTASNERPREELAQDDGSSSERFSDEGRRPVYIVLSGGVSRGAYESGYVSEIVGWLREHRDEFELKGIAGTSAGAINAMAGALDYCQSEAMDEPAGYTSWLPIGWTQLYEAEQVTEDAVFNQRWLRNHSLEVMRQYGSNLRADCDIDVVTAVTRSGDWAPSSSGQISTGTTDSIVRFLGWKVTADEDGGLRMLPLREERFADVEALTLPASSAGSIRLGDVSDALLASGAFPVAFPPVSVAYCEVLSQSQCDAVTPLRASFYDGGVFENTPLRALVPSIQAEDVRPVIIVVNLDQRDIPGESGSSFVFDDLMGTANSWLLFARTRGFRQAVETLRASGADLYSAQQRLPVAGGFLNSFMGFFDRRFRMVDHAVGAWDARRDLGVWPATRELFDPGQPAAAAVDRCIVEFLSTDQNLDDQECSDMLPSGVVAVLRGLASAALARCDELDVEPMACAEARTLRLLDRLDNGPVGRGNRRLYWGSAEPPSAELSAFLHELRRGDFTPEYQFANARRVGQPGYRPEIAYSILIESALLAYLDEQPGRSHFIERLSLETVLSTQLPIPPTPSFGFLLNLDQLEASGSFPLSNRVFVDVGLALEWGVNEKREESWHIFSGGPAFRLSYNFFENPATVAMLLSLDSGVLFGPVIPGVEDRDRAFRRRGRSRPNAAVYAGLAPRIVALRRLQIDVPVRTYWECSTASCSSFATANPAFDISIRLGWNFPFQRDVNRVEVQD